MPLKRGSSKKTVSKNIKEMVSSKTFAKGKSVAKRVAMAAAAAYKKARNSKSKKNNMDMKERIAEFTKDFEGLMKKHNVGLRAFIDKYGPEIEFVDLEKKDKESPIITK